MDQLMVLLKHWISNKKTRKLDTCCFVSTFGHFVSKTSDFFSSKKGISGREVRRAWVRYMSNFIIILDLMMFFQERIFLECKVERMLYVSMTETW